MTASGAGMLRGAVGADEAMEEKEQLLAEIGLTGPVFTLGMPPDGSAAARLPDDMVTAMIVSFTSSPSLQAPIAVHPAEPATAITTTVAEADPPHWAWNPLCPHIPQTISRYITSRIQNLRI